MKVSREQVIRFIRERGDDDHVAQAERELPETLDLPGDEGLLAQYGVRADDLDDGSVRGG